jgi:DNA repair protein RadD
MEESGATVKRWPHQDRAFDGTLRAMHRGVKRLCVTSPTGSGKTKIMTDLIEWATEESKCVVLYTHRKLLFDQTCAVLDGAGIAYGKRASGHETAYLRSHQVAMWQTEHSKVVRAKTRELHPADLVIVDEAHLAGGDQYQAILDAHVKSGAMVVGFTATPLDIGHAFDELLVAGTNSECREIGALVPAETYAPDEPDLRPIKNYRIGDELTENQRRQAIMRPGVFGRVLEAWQTHNPRERPTVLFGPDVKGSLYFAEEFTKAGIRAAHIDGNDCWLDGQFYTTDQETRDNIMELSRAGDIKVLCNRFVLREAWNAPWIEVGVFATVFGALTSYIQSGGRLLRANPGKALATIIDQGGNWHRHGSLNADRDWFLDGTNNRVVAERHDRLREQQEPEPIVCPNCAKVRHSGRVCPACGFESRTRSRFVVQIDGTLKMVEGTAYKPRRVKLTATTRQTWTRMYHRAKRSRNRMTFRQAEALHFVEEHHYPPRDLPLMPKNPADMWRAVADVPKEDLIPRSD